MLCLLASALFVTTGAWAVYRDLQSGIRVQDFKDLLNEDERPDGPTDHSFEGRAVNILVDLIFS